MKRNHEKRPIILLCLLAGLIAYILLASAFLRSIKSPAPVSTKPSAQPQRLVQLQHLEPIKPLETMETNEPLEEPSKPAYTEEELEILALIIYQEAGADYCLDSTRQMVGEVFLNRVSSSRYPNTFYEVATQRSQYGRLHWTGIMWPKRATLPQEQCAVERAYAVAESLLTESVDRLLPSDAIYQAEFEQGSAILAYQDGLYFCK